MGGYRTELGICRIAALMGLLGGSTIALPAFALTSPIGGAVALPAAADLRLPFPAGANVAVLAGYGPTMGSGFHTGTNASSSGNDFYALDLWYDDLPNGGLGEPIVAPAGGTVVLSGWATGGWANYGLRVVVAHDFGDGQIYHAIYCHLNAIDPAMVAGATITQGQLMGQLGRSCQGALSCPSFSAPHLHFALHQNSLVGGSGSGGSYGGLGVVPEPLDGVEDLLQGQVIVSTNTGQPSVCGDATCQPDETPDSCAQDCACLLPSPGGIVSESDARCFERFGSPSYWTAEASGHDDDHLWTTATEGPVDNFGRWTFEVAVDSPYRLEIFVAEDAAQSTMATYQIVHDDGVDSVVVDQSLSTGWTTIGSFRWAPGSNGEVTLEDATGEPLAENRRLVFDALRLVREDVPGASGVGGGGQGGSVGGMGAGGSASQVTVGGAGGGGEVNDDLGCGCRTAGETGERPPWWPLMAGALVLALGRRKQRVVHTETAKGAKMWPDDRAVRHPATR